MKALDIWLPAYLRHRLAEALRPTPSAGPTDVLFCVVDHFEPVSAHSSTVERERARMRAWMEGYPALAGRHRDSDGVAPQHTWFYPAEDYRAEYLEDLARLCQMGLGEIELHLHHAHDTPTSLARILTEAVAKFNRHGALITQGAQPVRTYGFIHGNLALNNSMRNPGLCGVNDELPVLKATGCYADFSMPTAPARSQTRKVNSVYYAASSPARPKGHDTGVDARVGGNGGGDMLLIQGPLALDLHRRKYGLLPRIDNGEVMGHYPGSPDRVRRWVRQRVHVKGRPEWIVVKASCHGAEEKHFPAVLGDPADRMYTDLEATFRDTPGYRLHYVTARELYNIVKAAEAGLTGDPGRYRDYLLPPYQNRPLAATDRSPLGAR